MQKIDLYERSFALFCYTVIKKLGYIKTEFHKSFTMRFFLILAFLFYFYSFIKLNC